MRTLGVLLSALLLLAVIPAPASAAAPTYGYTVLNEYPHDPAAFTQGLVWQDGVLYEGTGLLGESTLRKVELETGVVLKQHDLLPEHFGEGITAFQDTILQITWTQNVGFKYVEADTFEVVEQFAYPWEGWGITHDGTHLIASDGTATLRFLDPHTLGFVSQIEVQDGGVPVTQLNELEYVQGKVYANVRPTSEIAVIDPATGTVDAWLDLAGLRDSVTVRQFPGVLNGIAFDETNVRLFVTGKRWPRLFEIDVPTLIHPPVGAGEPDAPPVGAALSLRVSPNPCRTGANLAFSLPRGMHASLGIYDVRGRHVRGIADGSRRAGNHVVAFDVRALPAGTYFVRLTADGAQATERFLVLR